MKSKILSIVLIIVLLISCKKIDVPNPEMQNLFGEWEWIGSGGGEAFQLLTPESEGYDKVLKLTDNGIYKLYKNNLRIEKNRYKIKKNTSMVFRDLEYQITFQQSIINKKNPSELIIQFRGNDTLILYEDGFDAMSHEYVRKK